MVSRKQRTILILAATLGVYAFLYQPKLDINGYPVGYWSVFTNVDLRVQVGGQLTPDYRMIAAELAILTFITVCLYFGARPVKE